MFMTATSLSKKLTLFVKISNKKKKIVPSICYRITRNSAKTFKFEAAILWKFYFLNTFLNLNSFEFSHLNFKEHLCVSLDAETGSKASMLLFNYYYYYFIKLDRKHFQSTERVALRLCCSLEAGLQGSRLRGAPWKRAAIPFMTVAPQMAKHSQTSAADEYIRALVVICLL